MPVRRVSNRGGNVIGQFPSLKMERMIAFESSIERDLIYLLDFEKEIAWFEEQPLTLVYEHEGKAHKYTPDFHIIRNGQNVLVECKPAQRVHSVENQRKFTAARAWCDSRGWVFEVLTEQQLRGGYRLRNVKLLTQFARYDIRAGIQKHIQDFLTKVESPTVADVMTHIAPANPQTALIPILYMAFHHKLHLPLDHAPVSMESPISLIVARQGGDT